VWPSEAMPIPAFFRAMVAQLGGWNADWDLTPVLHLTKEDHERAAVVWDSLGIAPGRVLVACAMTSLQPDAAWPGFRQAVESCANRCEIEVAFCGSSADARVLQAAADRCSVKSHVLAGALPIRAFAAFLARCAALLCTDSGPRHVANAVGTPAVFVRRLGTEAIDSGVYCANEVDVAPPDQYLPLRRQVELLERLDPDHVGAVLAQAVARGRRRLAAVP
jgi:ADP-heptose:LPS heptosyltransferase